MAPREPTRAQFSSKLAYQSHTPSFLQKFKNRMNGVPDEGEDDDEEFERIGGGREPIPRRPRPTIPERPDGDPGSAEEDDGDEKPQIVVLKTGKHLTEREVENVRRAEKGLPPLPEDDKPLSAKEPSDRGHKTLETTLTDSKASTFKNLSFSSSSSAKFKSNKRKATHQPEEVKFSEDSEKKTASSKHPAKKAKKEKKTLLSFGDDA